MYNIYIKSNTINKTYNNINTLSKCYKLIIDNYRVFKSMGDTSFTIILHSGDNIVIRLSGTMIDGKNPIYSHTSTVVTIKNKATCRSFDNEGMCGDCRKCWDKNISNVSYLAH